MKSRSRREREATLAIVSPEAERIADEIAEIEELPGLRLARRSDQSIRDVYYDTAEGTLGKSKLALRIRRVEGRTYVALKGPERAEDGGETSRSELEARSSIPQLERISARLRREGADLDLQSQQDAEATLRDAGLEPIQDRETLRRRRRVDAIEGTEVRPLAELTVDAVVYRVADAPVRHFEIEIESVGLKGVDVISRVASALHERWGSALRDWEHSKLVTGLALERLARDGDLSRAWLDPKRVLTPKAYEALDRHLQEPEPDEPD